MFRERLHLFLWGLFLVGVMGFLGLLVRPIEASDEVVLDEETVWDTDKTVEGNVVIRGYVSVPEGIRLTVAPGSTVSFDGGELSVSGMLDIRGTAYRPVTVRSRSAEYSAYAITVYGSMRARHATFSNGGNMTVPTHNLFVPTAYALFQKGVIAFSGTSLDIAHCVFSQNEVNVSLSGNGNARVWASVFRNAPSGMVVADTFFGTPDFRYNYWDGKDPEVLKDWNSPEYGIIGTVQTDHWIDSEDTHDPVLIVPGLLGSWQWTPRGDFVLDPVLGTYTSLIETFSENGYSEGNDLFRFPYNWRQSNAVTEQMLREKIAEIRQKTDWPLVDVLSHSMGGLAVRQYIASSSYTGDIDTFVTLGTPHEGAPESYLAWEGGDFNFSDALMYTSLRFIFSQESKENGYADIFSYIRGAPVTAIEELLPNYPYLQRVGSSDLLAYSQDSPENSFLENISTPNAMDDLKETTLVNIAGSLGNFSTITKFRVGDVRQGNDPILWEHGKPDGYDDVFGDHGLVFGAGDGTVPLSSATAIDADVSETISAGHRQLPDAAKELVYRHITGYEPGKRVYSPIVSDVVIVQALSPIDIAIEDDRGRMVGTDPETGETRIEIPGAFYTSGDAESEFLTIPNPDTGTYRVLSRGTGSGAFTIRAVSLRERDGTTQESVQEFVGTAQRDVKSEYAISLGSNGLLETPSDVPPESDTPNVPENVPSYTASPDTSSSDSSSSDDSDEKKSKRKKFAVPAQEKISSNGSKETAVVNETSFAESPDEQSSLNEGDVRNDEENTKIDEASSDTTPRFSSIFLRTLPIWIFLILAILWKKGFFKKIVS